MAGDEGAMMALLQAQEARISAPCLKHVPSLTDTEPLPSVEEMAPETERDALFSATVDAVQIIVRDKLYKARAKSLESYFNVSWHISRAQVYRYLDCASVLDALEGFDELPNRERLCRSMKRLARTREETRALWQRVLDLGYKNPVPTAAVESAFEQLKSGIPLVVKAPPKGASSVKPSLVRKPGSLVSPALSESPSPASKQAVPKITRSRAKTPTQESSHIFSASAALEKLTKSAVAPPSKGKARKRRRTRGRYASKDDDEEEEEQAFAEEEEEAQEEDSEEMEVRTDDLFTATSALMDTSPVSTANRRTPANSPKTQTQNKRPRAGSAVSAKRRQEQTDNPQQTRRYSMNSKTLPPLSSVVQGTSGLYEVTEDHSALAITKTPLKSPSKQGRPLLDTSSPSHWFHSPANRSTPARPPPIQTQPSSVPETITTRSFTHADMELHIATLFSSLDTLRAHGYTLQPFLHGQWESTPITEWRMAPIGWSTKSSSNTLGSRTSSTHLSGQTISATNSTSRHDDHQDVEMQNAARDLYLLSSTASL